MGDKNGDKVRILPVQKYSGDPSRFAEFIAEYYRVASVYGWKPDQMISRLTLHLDGLAEKVRSRLPTPQIRHGRIFVKVFEKS